MTTKHFVYATLLAAPLAGPLHVAHAQTAPAQPTDSTPVAASPGDAADAASPEALDQRLRVLERRLEIQQEDAKAAAAAAPVVKASASGFSIATPNGAFRIALHAVLNIDNRYYYNEFKPSGGTTPLDRGVDTTLLRLARPIIDGTVGNLVDFRFTPDFAGGKTVIQDAYATVKFLPAFNVTAGKFKSPVGLERLQSDTDTRFVERALPDRLIPNRDLGIQFSGNLLGPVLAYQLAYLNGTIDGGSTDNSTNVPSSSVDGDPNNSKDIAARLFSLPFANSQLFALRGLGVGIGASRGHLHGWVDGSTTPATSYSLLTSYKTNGQQTFFSYRSANTATGTAATLADGLRQRIAPQAYYYNGPFGLLGEYVVSKTAVSRVENGSATVDRATLANRAWQIAGAWFITGEDEGYKYPAPRRPYTVGGEGWGALEFVARYAVLDIDDAAFVGGANSFADPTKSANRASAWTVGLTWTLTQNFKTLVNYETTRFDGGATAAAGGDSPTEKVLFSRFQLSY
ncbi:MAG TPA: porin [Steroidobacteraceae bacterium]|nr:porin [Steroidobacteraceae bacterium]